VKFLVDAQLPQHLAKELTRAGYDTLHTLDLPHGNRTRDEELAALATRDDRILITKNSDFVTTFHLQHSPPSSYLFPPAILLMQPSCNGSSQILFTWNARSSKMISWN